MDTEWEEVRCRLKEFRFKSVFNIVALSSVDVVYYMQRAWHVHVDPDNQPTNQRMN